jgi:serine/threonine protein phosphatase PrpC
MKYSIAQESRIGGREINQDRAGSISTTEAVLLMVADGMGGHMQGEVAAQIAIDTLTEQFRRLATPRLQNPAAFLSVAMRMAHQTIVRYADECRIPAHAAPRTTCIACVIQDGTACWAHAGDSRLYLVHGSDHNSHRVAHTRDHSIVQRMLDEGQITQEEAASHPLRHRVFSCLGGDATPQIEVSPPVVLMDGDVVALCTDGAWAPMGPEAAKLVASLGGAPLNTTIPDLLDTAEQVAGDGADNLTIIALRWEAPAIAAGIDVDQDTITITVVGQAADQRVEEVPISDAEIERAIADIRQRISRTPSNRTP